MAESWRGNPSYTITTHVDGLMDISENFDSYNTLIASNSMRDASNTAGSGYQRTRTPIVLIENKGCMTKKS